MANPFSEKFVRSVRVPDDVCRYATMDKNKWIQSTFCIRHLHYIFDPILSLFCNVKVCQRDNLLKKYEILIFYFINTL